MLVNFSIQNFGSVRNKQTLSFEADRSDLLEDHYIIHYAGRRLLKLGLLYGANASGKTTILRALDFLRELVLEPVEKKTDLLRFQPFLFDRKTPKENSILSIEFIQNNIPYSYEVEFNQKAIVREELNFFDPNKANVFKRTTDLESQFSSAVFGSKIKFAKGAGATLLSNTLWNNSVFGGFLKTNVEIPELKDVVDWFKIHLPPVVYTKNRLNDYVTNQIENAEFDKAVLISILKRADFNISDIMINDDDKPLPDSVLRIINALDLPEDTKEKVKNMPQKKIEFEHTVKGSRYFLPFTDESEGTQRYFGFAGLLSLLINKSVVVPIDEIEASLHPDLLTHFLLAFLVNSKESQLIATTHNREILSNRDLFRNDAIWFTNKDQNSATELYSLADFDSSVIRDTSNVFNAYRIGKLGGVPQLGDYYVDRKNEKSKKDSKG